MRGCRGGLCLDDAFVVHSVDEYFERRVEPHGTQILRLVLRRHGVEPPAVEDAVAGEGVDGHVAYAERCHVLEEVGALAGLDAEILQSALYYDFRFGYVAPLDRYAEPRVA